MERDAGAAAHFPDALYEAAGATIAPDAAAAGARRAVAAKVQRPRPDEAACLDEGSALVALLQPPPGTAFADDPSLRALAARRVTALALELVPRITRAQSHGRALVAGHRRRLQGRAARRRRAAAASCPMLTTAAGTITPAKAFVIGAGVAGLQAIATARRLGAVVSRVRRARRGARAGAVARRDVRGERSS